MLAWLARVRFVRQRLSYAELARQTQTPLKRVMEIARGNMEPPAQFLKNVTNLYRREAYSRMLNAGVPRIEATALRSSSVERVTSVLQKADWLTDYWGRGTWKHIIDAQQIAEDSQEAATILREVKDRIARSLNDSLKSIDEIWTDQVS